MIDFKWAAELIGRWFELLGIITLVAGAIVAFVLYGIALLQHRSMPGVPYLRLRRDLGKAILVGLEMLVGADIIRSVAIDPTFQSIGVLGLLVVVRTFLSWSLEVEVTGAWPWQHKPIQMDAPTDAQQRDKR